jgi:hypothetical protein
MPRRTAGPRRPIPGSPFNAQREAAAMVVPDFQVDDRVTHDRYGLGTVVGLEPEACIVTFGSEVRRISLTGGKLHKL